MNPQDTINRTIGLSKTHEFEYLFTFKNFPVFMGVTTQTEDTDKFCDMNFFIEKNSGMLQLNPILPLEIVYYETHNSGAIGDVWLNHHKQFAKFIQSFFPASVLEIGGGSGILSKLYSENIDWTIVEPNPTPVENCTATFVSAFFDENFSIDPTVDIIIHSHVLEHTYDPEKFIRNLSLSINGRKMVFSLPNMKEMLKNKYLNFMNFEHTIYLDEDHIELLLSRYGFSIIRKEYYLDDHSIFYAVEKDGAQECQLPKDIYETNKMLFKEYIEYNLNFITGINEKIKTITSPIYLFGAHIFSQYTVALGINTSKIIGIIDNDKDKQGKRLYGTKFMTYPATVLSGIESPVIILRAGIFNTEIKESILTLINPSTIFLE